MNLVTVLGASELGQYHALTVMEWLDVMTVSGSEVRLLLGRGLDREVGVCMCVFFCASSLMLHVT